MAREQAYDGDVMRHREDDLWHVTKFVEVLPGGNRIVHMYCGRKVPIVAAVVAKLKPLNADPDEGPGPGCSGCFWQILARYRELTGLETKSA
jgi:hypothetical protein